MRQSFAVDVRLTLENLQGDQYEDHWLEALSVGERFPRTLFLTSAITCSARIANVGTI